MFSRLVNIKQREIHYRTFNKNSLLHLINIISSSYTKNKADYSIVKLNKSAQVPLRGAMSTQMVMEIEEIMAFMEYYDIEHLDYL